MIRVVQRPHTQLTGRGGSVVSFWRITVMSHTANQSRYPWRRAVALLVLSGLSLAIAPAWGTDKSLVLYLPFDEGNGTVANDASSYKNNGTVVGNAQWVQGHSATALEFVTGSHVTVPEIPQYDVTAQVSVMAWVKTSTVPNWCRVVDKSQYQTSGFDLVLTLTTGYPAPRVLRQQRHVAGRCEDGGERQPMAFHRRHLRQQDAASLR